MRARSSGGFNDLGEPFRVLRRRFNAGASRLLERLRKRSLPLCCLPLFNTFRFHSGRYAAATTANGQLYAGVRWRVQRASARRARLPVWDVNAA